MLGGPSTREQVAFTAVDGTAVTRGEVDHMALFLGTDGDDKLSFGGMWGPNFLNDGVIKKDFLESGLGEMLAERYSKDLKPDLDTRLEKEKRYTFYTHPQAKFINAEAAWGYFAPDVKTNFSALRQTENAEDPASIKARAQLFLSEKSFPAPALKQVLQYQERQYGWLQPDANLDRTDLSLFGYHTVEDWFGPRFVRLIAEFIINSAKIAEQKGYVVTKEEAQVDLVRNAEMSYRQNKNSPYLGVANASEYLNEQLRRMGMEQSQAVNMWRQVLLFRRLFQDVGNAVFVDPFEYQKFDEYAQETVEGELYRLPKALRFAKAKEWQKLEVYLDATTKRGSEILMLPTTFLAVEDVERRNPELVQKRYLMEFAEVNKKSLQSKVSLKETWAWESSDKGWEQLKQKFPELGIKKGSNSDERFATLESLDDNTRGKIDAYARASIVDSKPELLKAALDQAKLKKMAVSIRLKGESLFAGLENPEELIQLLDSTTPKAAEHLKSYTADGETYYRIIVLDRDPKKEIVTFADASRDGILDNMLYKKVEADYLAIREGRAEEFQQADKSWKRLPEVWDLVSDHYFDKAVKAIREDYQQNAPQLGETKTTFDADFYATHRLYKYVREAKAKIQENPETASAWYRKPKEDATTDQLSPSEPLADQWKLDKEDYKLSRSEGSALSPLDATTVFSLPLSGWSAVYVAPNGSIAFFQLQAKANGTLAAAVAAKMDKVQKLLSFEAQRTLMHNVLNDIGAKNAISLEYLNKGSDDGEPSISNES